MAQEEFKKALKRLSSEDKDKIYDSLWAEYVREDIEDFLSRRKKSLREDQIEVVVDAIVYNVGYDNSLPYWRNIQNLVGQVEKIA
jgi:hypothetical protein